MKKIFALLLLFSMAICLVSCAGSESPNCTLYFKDKELYFSDFSHEPMQISTSFYCDPDTADNYINNSLISSFCTLSNDEKILFYPDKLDSPISYYNTSISLYYRYLNKPNKEPVKISSEITFYEVNEQATFVTYLKGKDRSLYQYSLKSENAEKIGSNVGDFKVAADGETVYYLDDENKLYVYRTGKDKVEIDSDVTAITTLTDNNTVYYIKNSSLYKKSLSNSQVKIADNIEKVLFTYESGELYYLQTNEEEELHLSDFVYDDMKETDAAMVEPEAPERPSQRDYGTNDEYNTALNEYYKKYKVYEDAYNTYQKKVLRDLFREAMKTEAIDGHIYTLSYYDGGKATTVLNNCISTYEEVAQDSPAIIIEAMNPSLKIKFSEIKDSANPVEDVIASSSKIYIVSKAKTSMIEHDNIENICINSEGDTVYYVSETSEENECGDLYKVQITRNSISDATLYDSDVYTNSMSFVADDKFVYFKDIARGPLNSHGDLYLNKKKVDYDVDTSSVEYIGETNTLVYYTDWNVNKGTLKAYAKGKSKKISDDVYSYSLHSNGSILYLFDYSTTHNKGDLYVYSKGKAERIDVDVVAILSVSRER